MLEVFKEHKWWFVFILGLICLYLLILVFMIFPISQYSIEKAGQLGDSFGILNSLFSGLAFIALVITIYLQQQDMRDSKEETIKQNFEATFFNLINIHNDLVNSFRDFYIAEDNKKHFMYGGEALSFFLDKFKKGGFSCFYTLDENLSEDENMENAYKYRNIDQDTLRINLQIKSGGKNLKFIENVYSILNLIDRANFLDDKDRKFYLETLHAQISDEEVILIFYYTHGIKDDMKLLIEKYHFFENIDVQLLHNWEKEILLYKKEAFNKNLWGYFPS